MKTEFEPGAYLRKVSGKDYLEVKWRLVWLRDKHPDASLETELVQLDLDKEFAIFRARVVIPGGGDATGYGSETKRDFTDFIEKGETKAVGRALAALGFGTQFCDDFEAVDASGVTHVADSPVEKPAISGKAVSEKQESQPQGATNAQMQFINKLKSEGGEKAEIIIATALANAGKGNIAGLSVDDAKALISELKVKRGN